MGSSIRKLHTFCNWISRSNVFTPSSFDSIFFNTSNTEAAVWKTWTAKPFMITFYPLVAPDFATNILSTSSSVRISVLSEKERYYWTAAACVSSTFYRLLAPLACYCCCCYVLFEVHVSTIMATSSVPVDDLFWYSPKSSSSTFKSASLRVRF